jgi:hypothetical protein
LSIVLPLAAIATLEGLGSAIGIAVASRTLLGSLGIRRVTEGWRAVVRMAFVTSWMLGHAGGMTARGVIQGFLGSGSAFLRTPKKGAGLDAQRQDSPEMAE